MCLRRAGSSFADQKPGRLCRHTGPKLCLELPPEEQASPEQPQSRQRLQHLQLSIQIPSTASSEGKRWSRLWWGTIFAWITFNHGLFLCSAALVHNVEVRQRSSSKHTSSARKILIYYQGKHLKHNFPFTRTQAIFSHINGIWTHSISQFTLLSIIHFHYLRICIWRYKV